MARDRALVAATACIVAATLLAMVAAAADAASTSGAASAPPPNILFIIDESTDGRAYYIGNDEAAPMELPNIKGRIAKAGTAFNSSYVVSPVCCPSRAAIWGGRHVHRMPHAQVNPSTGLHVNGAWNNHEGWPAGFNKTIFDVLSAYGNYSYKISGKTDWSAGGHSISARTAAWAEKVAFPYTLRNGSYGWYNEAGPLPVVHTTGNRTHPEDWKAAGELADWIKAQEPGKPWFGFFGANIVHPPYVTTQNWLDKVDRSKVTVPQWTPLDKMHPEDFAATMKKKMASSECCTQEQILDVRQVYLAMIVEFDAMVGLLLDAVDAFNAKSGDGSDKVVVVVTSDHGDMQMTHRQFYKMSPLESSARVPLIFRGPGVAQGKVVNNVTDSLSFFPTFAEIAQLPPEATADLGLDGESLVPYLAPPGDASALALATGPGGAPRAPPRNWSVSQFHGDDIRLSWFLLRQGDWKLITYGSGAEVPARLFNIAEDPEELTDLASAMPDRVASMDAFLRTVIDYPAVAADVEAYNKDSWVRWRDSMSPAQYNKTVSTGTRWAESWAYDSEGAFEAIDAWLKTPNDTFAWAVQGDAAMHRTMHAAGSGVQAGRESDGGK